MTVWPSLCVLYAWFSSWNGTCFCTQKSRIGTHTWDSLKKLCTCYVQCIAVPQKNRKVLCYKHFLPTFKWHLDICQKSYVSWCRWYWISCLFSCWRFLQSGINELLLTSLSAQVSGMLHYWNFRSRNTPFQGQSASSSMLPFIQQGVADFFSAVKATYSQDLEYCDTQSEVGLFYLSCCWHYTVSGEQLRSPLCRIQAFTLVSRIHDRMAPTWASPLTSAQGINWSTLHCQSCPILVAVV